MLFILILLINDKGFMHIKMIRWIENLYLPTY